MMLYAFSAITPTTSNVRLCQSAIDVPTGMPCSSTPRSAVPRFRQTSYSNCEPSGNISSIYGGMIQGITPCSSVLSYWASGAQLPLLSRMGSASAKPRSAWHTYRNCSLFSSTVSFFVSIRKRKRPTGTPSCASLASNLLIQRMLRGFICRSKASVLIVETVLLLR